MYFDADSSLQDIIENLSRLAQTMWLKGCTYGNAWRIKASTRLYNRKKVWPKTHYF